MDSALARLLTELRAGRGFRAPEVLAAKVGRVRRWFATEGLDAAVVGVSGGIDSAVVLGLLAASRGEGGPRVVVPLLLPIAGAGATAQGESVERGRRVCLAFGIAPWEAPLGTALAGLVTALEGASGRQFGPWAEGQMLSVIRTPALYGAAALLQQEGLRSVVVGTTNRDEGAYLGFFGKASDGMVDLQPISDLHKSEVVALARLLGVPEDVIAADPSGDVWDGRSDAEMIGVSYDEVELVLRLRELGFAPEAIDLDPAARLVLEQLVEVIGRRHAQNAHKYRCGSPAIHLDVMPRGLPGGWAEAAFRPNATNAPETVGREERRPPAGVLPGAWEPEDSLLLDPPRWPRLICPDRADPAHLAAGPPDCWLADGVLTGPDCDRLIGAMAAAGPGEPVGVTGVRDDYGVGSVRASAWSPGLAAQLWSRLRPVVPAFLALNERSPTDGFATAERSGHRHWRAVGLSPLLRFMRYDAGGRHLAHYDAAYDYGDGRRTLLSVVFYLTGREGRDGGAGADEAGGRTRFIRDGQERLASWERSFDDWDRDAREDEVELAVAPRVGRALVFLHRCCHDVERWDGPRPRVIIRGDVVYEAVPGGPSLGPA